MSLIRRPVRLPRPDATPPDLLWESAAREHHGEPDTRPVSSAGRRPQRRLRPRWYTNFGDEIVFGPLDGRQP